MYKQKDLEEIIKTENQMKEIINDLEKEVINIRTKVEKKEVLLEELKKIKEENEKDYI